MYFRNLGIVSAPPHAFWGYGLHGWEGGVPHILFREITLYFILNIEGPASPHQNVPLKVDHPKGTVQQDSVFAVFVSSAHLLQDLWEALSVISHSVCRQSVRNF